MKIGIIIGRIGGVDGVALETEKWIMVLERLGHEVYVASGEFEYWKMDDQKHFQLPILSFFHLNAKRSKKSFLSQIRNQILFWILLSIMQTSLQTHLKVGF